mmetsp:Transcript_6328/g.9050  ORF Transcript_6328/g.9050 Transcript_6328/m.9050 type:complete len:102 (-) Transcript_6328:75-380(-)
MAKIFWLVQNKNRKLFNTHDNNSESSSFSYFATCDAEFQVETFTTVQQKSIVHCEIYWRVNIYSLVVSKKMSIKSNIWMTRYNLIKELSWECFLKNKNRIE